MPQAISTVTNIAHGATWTSPWTNTDFFVSLTGSVYADQPVTVNVDQSGDGTDADITTSQAITASTGTQINVCTFALPFVRVRITNTGSSDTTTIRVFTRWVRGENP